MRKYFIVTLARDIAWVFAVLLFVLFFYEGGGSGAVRILFEALLSGVIARFAIGELVRLIYGSERPFLKEKSEELFKYPRNTSFPSGHALFFFAVTTTVLFYNWIWGVLFLFLSILISFGRVWARIHWFLDVLSGAAIGIGIAVIIHLSIAGIL